MNVLCKACRAGLDPFGGVRPQHQALGSGPNQTAAATDADDGDFDVLEGQAATEYAFAVEEMDAR